jgi:hypothetical protein
MKPTLIFVYNADSGLFNTMTDVAQKNFSPQTYSCNLCALTRSNFDMCKDWKKFIETLKLPVRFLHADELKARHSLGNVSLPVVLIRQGERIESLVDADSINACQNIGKLKQVIEEKLR